MSGVIRLSEWHTPASDYPDKKHGPVRLVTTRYRRGFYEAYGTAPPCPPDHNHDGRCRSFQFWEAVRPIPIKTLRSGRQVLMVDDPPHWWSIQEHADTYSGHVLVAGLGLGLIVHALEWNPRVTGVTIIENSRNVIDLIDPLLPQGGKWNILWADWWDTSWEKKLHPTFEPVNGVFFDLLSGPATQAVLAQAIMAAVDMQRRWPKANMHRVFGVKHRKVSALAQDILAAEHELVTARGDW